MTRVKHAAYYLFPALLSLALYWYSLQSWFWRDDFAWLGLPLQLQEPGGIWRVLFTPHAQGTVRLWSERVFFLVFSSLFGLDALPFHIAAFLTEFANLALVAWIGKRITGSSLAGFLAAVLWVANPQLATPMSWASAYNEILCGFFLLSAFSCLLRYIDTGQRKWWVAQWALFVLGFGALELNIVYPAIAALYTLCAARKHFLKTLPLFAASVVFGIVEFLFVPRSTSPVYAMEFSARMAANFLQYTGWAVGPSRAREMIHPSLQIPGLAATALIGLALAGFFIRKVLRREWVAVFCAGWFLIVLAPVLPLVNHVTEYYLTLPVIGLCLLGGWAFAEAWRNGIAWRAAAVFLAAVYLVGGAAEIHSATRWFYERSRRIRDVVLAVEDVHEQNPEKMIILAGVDNNLFQAGFEDDPFRLFGLSRIYLALGSEKGIQTRVDAGGIARWELDPRRAVEALDAGQAVALSVADNRIVNITSRYRLMARAQLLEASRAGVNVGDPALAARLGPTWYGIEGGFRWMPKSATVQLGGPGEPGERLYVAGYAPAAVVAKGPVTLTFRAAGRLLGRATLRKPDDRFSLDFPLPDELVGQYAVQVEVEVDHVLKLPGDARDLGMIFGTFAIR